VATIANSRATEAADVFLAADHGLSKGTTTIPIVRRLQAVNALQRLWAPDRKIFPRPTSMPSKTTVANRILTYEPGRVHCLVWIRVVLPHGQTSTPKAEFA